MSLTFNEFQEAMRDRSLLPPYRDYNQAADDWHWADHICGEFEELCDGIHKGESTEYKAKELADIISYCVLYANWLGIDIGETVRNKFNEVSDRYGITLKL